MWTSLLLRRSREALTLAPHIGLAAAATLFVWMFLEAAVLEARAARAVRSHRTSESWRLPLPPTGGTVWPATSPAAWEGSVRQFDER
jgi:hypothetical protein